jgi:hypothetical protein
MTPGRLAIDLWMAGVVLSLAGIGLFAVLGTVVSLLTAARSRRQARRPRDLGQLPQWYPEAELAAIDEALDRILTEEHGALPAQRSE